MTCRLFGFHTVGAVPHSDPCAVCMTETGDFVKFPTSCGHVFCASCVRELVFHRERSIDFISPSVFGGPKCPNACANPDVGRQCDCDEYADALFEWAHIDFEGFAKWSLEKEKIRIRSEKDSARGSRVCPICREKVPVPKNIGDLLRTEIIKQIAIL